MGFIGEAIIGGVSAVLDTSQWNDEGVIAIIETHAQSGGGISHASTQHKGMRGLHRGTLAPKGDGKGLQSVGGIPVGHRNGAQSAGSIENRRFHCIAFTSLSDIAHIDQIGSEKSYRTMGWRITGSAAAEGNALNQENGSRRDRKIAPAFFILNSFHIQIALFQ